MSTTDPPTPRRHRTDAPGERDLGNGELHPFLVEGRADVLAHRGASSLHPPGNTERAFAAALEWASTISRPMCRSPATGWSSSSTTSVSTTPRRRRAPSPTTSGPNCDGPHDRRRAGDRGRPRPPRRAARAVPHGVLQHRHQDRRHRRAGDPHPRRADTRSRVCVAAFGWRRLRAVRRRLGPGWCSAMAKPEIAVTRIAAWLRIPVPRLADVVQLPTTYRGRTIVDRRFVEACHRSGVAVHVWTVNDPEEATRLRALGVDAVISDRPDEVG
jgi:hypothetical protein